jgi:N-acetylglucosamine kinase-like BadF-type ATPase
MYAIGIDRGGSYTRISVFDSSFNEIKTHNFISDSLEHFVKETLEFYTSIKAEKIPTVISCKGAMTRKEIRDYIYDNLSSKINLKKVISDAEGAHRAAFDEGSGFLIIVGTGSVLIYKKEENYLIEGGKNPPGGDPGSGKWIGLKYLKEKKIEYENWNDQKIASYTNEVIKNSKENKDEICLEILKNAFEELCKLIKQALEKFENLGEIKIALIGGVTSDEFFRNELDKYANENIKNIKIKFFVPETSIQKASAMYAIKLEK